MRTWEALTQEDRDELVGYVGAYGNIHLGDDEYAAERVFFEWSDYKRFLFEKVFDGKFRVRVPVRLTQNKNETESALRNIYRVPYISDRVRSVADYLECHREDEADNRFVHSVLRHIQYLQDNVASLAPLTKADCVETARVFTFLLKYSCVTSNQIPYRSLEYKYPVFGKGHVHTARIQYGSKTVKAIRTLLVNIGYDDMGLFESWREAVSAATTVRERNAELVLSIHPIDFMTMSDNDCGWRSCMHWSGGEYSNGTIEMMNSPYVVVGYLESQSAPTMRRCGHDIPNKSWRCLFYVTDKMILSGKAYPYADDGLCVKGVETLRDMVGDAFGCGYEDKVVEYDDMDWYACHYNGCDMGSAYTVIHVSETDYDWDFDYDEEDEDDAEFDCLEDKIAHECDGRVLVAVGEFMYNDLYEDSSYKYWCVKRKGLHGLHGIDVGGQCTCMCCGAAVFLVDMDDVSDKYCAACANKYMCDDGTLRPGEHVYQVELEDGNEVRMTEDMMYQELWWRPANESFLRKDQETTVDAYVLDTDICKLNDFMSMRGSEPKELERYFNDNGVKFVTKPRTVVQRMYDSFNDTCVTWATSLSYDLKVFFADDLDEFETVFNDFRKVVEVDLGDEVQNSRAVLL